MDSNINENVVLYDWLSFTSKKHTPEELIEALGLSHCPWTDTKGARGYMDRKYFGCISIHYNGREDMGVCVRCPVKAAETLKICRCCLISGKHFLISFIPTICI